MAVPASKTNLAAGPRRDFRAGVISEEPLIRIRPGRSTVLFELRESWAHRELLYFLIWRDLKVRYRQTLLGAAWVILQPLLTAMVFTVFFSKLARVPSGGVPYAVFAYAALLPWMFFSNAVSTSCYSLVSSSYIITKVYLPRLLIPLSVVGVRFVDFLVASVPMTLMMLWYGFGVRFSMLMVPVLVAEITIFTLGISVWFSVLNIKYRDVGTLLPVLIQLWMFVSPIIYPATLVPPNWRFVYSLNPIAGIVEGLRSALLGGPFDWTSIAISAVVTLVSLGYCVYAFCRWEENLIDIL